MKEISQEEFEEKLEGLINGSITKQELTKELHIGLKTLNKKIEDLSETNPELYKRIVSKMPYIPRDIHIDAVSLAVAVIQYGREATSEEVGISIRTISRKVKELQSTNPELYNLYLIRNKKMSRKQREVYNMRVMELSNGNEPKRSGLEDREKEIRDVLDKFEQLVESGMPKKDAAKALGYAGYPTIWNMYNDLDRLQKAKQLESEKSKEERFRSSIKLDIQPVTGGHTSNETVDKSKTR